MAHMFDALYLCEKSIDKEQKGSRIIFSLCFLGLDLFGLFFPSRLTVQDGTS